jgi:sugar lactone lactonase YvrE
VAYYRFDDGTSFVPGVQATSMSPYPEPAWQKGQAQDFVAAYSNDWLRAWAHAATLAGGGVLSLPGEGVKLRPLRREPGIIGGIEPAGARDAGGAWSHNGGTNWYEDQHFERVAPGKYTVTFKPLAGWATPASQTVTVPTNVSVYVEGVYLAYDVIGSSGTAVGQFRKPRGIAFAANGDMYVADSDNHRLQYRNRLTGVWTAIGRQGTQAGQFNQPFGLTFDRQGNLYVADAGNHRIQRRDPAGKWTVWGGYGTWPGRFNGPWDVAVDGSGNLYVADRYNQRVQRRASTGAWSVFLSNGSGAANVRSPSGLEAVENRLFVADLSEQAGPRVRAFDLSGRLAATFASGTTGGVVRVRGLAMMTPSRDTLLAADSGANTIFRMSAGTVPAALVGPGLLTAPEDLACDGLGNVVVTDTGSNRLVRLRLP